MDEQKKEIMAELLEKLIEDVVSKSQDSESDESATTSAVDDFLNKLNQQIALTEQEIEKLRFILDDFINEVCASLKNARAGAVNVSDLIMEYINQIPNKISFKLEDVLIFSSLLDKLTIEVVRNFDATLSVENISETTTQVEEETPSTENVVDDFINKASQRISMNEEAVEKLRSVLDDFLDEISAKLTAARSEAVNVSLLIGEYISKIPTKIEINVEDVLTFSVLLEELTEDLEKIFAVHTQEETATTSASPVSSTCPSECAFADAGVALSSTGIPCEDTCAKDEEPKKMEPTESQKSAFVSKVVDKVMSHVLEEIQSHSTAKKPCCKHRRCPRSRTKRFYLRFGKWGIIVFIFYLLLFPFTVFLGIIFGQAVCHQGLCNNNWNPLIGPFFKSPSMYGSSMNVYAAF